MSPRNVISFVAAMALLPSSLFADPNDGGKKDPGQPAATTPPPAPPTAPAQPKGLKVPNDLPVISTKDVGDGLIIEELKIGTGAEAKPNGSVVAHYHGTLKTGGPPFDSSFERGEPLVFSLSQTPPPGLMRVIPGWQKGLPGMKVGGVRRLNVPSKLAYGEAGHPAGIPGNADLIFVVEMVDTVQIDDLKVGDGEAVGPRAFTLTAHTIKGADGKDLGSATKDKPSILLPGEVFGMEGMKVGGRRKISIPAQLNRANPQYPSTVPHDVAITIEIELLQVRNLTPPG